MDFCHCNRSMNGSDHCPACGCEEYERDCGSRDHTYHPHCSCAGCVCIREALETVCASHADAFDEVVRALGDDDA